LDTARENRESPPPHRLLFVDDEPPILFALKKYFIAQGFAVDTACELEEAQALLACNLYSLVLADLRLTTQDRDEGLELIQFIRYRYPRTKIILLTAFGSQAIENEALRRGVDAFLLKPQPLAELHQVVVALLAETA
jgi:DNA-binding response OmpR family regulator